LLCAASTAAREKCRNQAGAETCCGECARSLSEKASAGQAFTLSVSSIFRHLVFCPPPAMLFAFA
jgi:hypothetical protein